MSSKDAGTAIDEQSDGESASSPKKKRKRADKSLAAASSSSSSSTKPKSSAAPEAAGTSFKSKGRKQVSLLNVMLNRAALDAGITRTSKAFRPNATHAREQVADFAAFLSALGASDDALAAVYDSFAV